MKLNVHSALLKLFSVVIVTLLASTITSAQSVDDYKKMAERGDADVQYNMGLYYLNEGNSHDYDGAIKWLCMAAEQGYNDAQKRLNDMGEIW